MPKLDDLGVAEAAKAIRTGETTAEALAEALLTRAAAHASLNGSGQQARRSARCMACRSR